MFLQLFHSSWSKKIFEGPWICVDGIECDCIKFGRIPSSVNSSYKSNQFWINFCIKKECALINENQFSRMPSYTYTSTTTTTTSEGTTSRNMRAASAGSDLDDLYFKSFCMSDGDRCRMGREFFSPAPISLTGNYWPRYSNCDKSVPQTGSAFVTYLARPYLNYKTPSTYASKYGHSKYINIRKLWSYYAATEF